MQRREIAQPTAGASEMLPREIGCAGEAERAPGPLAHERGGDSRQRHGKPIPRAGQRPGQRVGAPGRGLGPWKAAVRCRLRRFLRRRTRRAPGRRRWREVASGSGDRAPPRWTSRGAVRIRRTFPARRGSDDDGASAVKTHEIFSWGRDELTQELYDASGESQEKTSLPIRK